MVNWDKYPRWVRVRDKFKTKANFIKNVLPIFKRAWERNDVEWTSEDNAEMKEMIGETWVKLNSLIEIAENVKEVPPDDDDDFDFEVYDDIDAKKLTTGGKIKDVPQSFQVIAKHITQGLRKGQNPDGVISDIKTDFGLK